MIIIFIFPALVEVNFAFCELCILRAHCYIESVTSLERVGACHALHQALDSSYSNSHCSVLLLTIEGILERTYFLFLDGKHLS